MSHLELYFSKYTDFIKNIIALPQSYHAHCVELHYKCKFSLRENSQMFIPKFTPISGGSKESNYI